MFELAPLTQPGALLILKLWSRQPRAASLRSGAQDWPIRHVLGWVGGQTPQEVLKLHCNFGKQERWKWTDCLKMKIVNLFLQLFGQEGLFHIYKG